MKRRPRAKKHSPAWQATKLQRALTQQKKGDNEAAARRAAMWSSNVTREAKVVEQQSRVPRHVGSVTVRCTKKAEEGFEDWMSVGTTPVFDRKLRPAPANSHAKQLLAAALLSGQQRLVAASGTDAKRDGKQEAERDVIIID
eukprot:TRINITY_DN19600_c0_g1_i4.p1 TRINITY_DN19600_c0_g1~~TRINITY_DN19600_c0_g1_i4.p1  ORF type:complete len:142 (-),score=41.25 TRINITY_DN19600_c0_g1_i4:169-594(-)